MLPRLRLNSGKVMPSEKPTVFTSLVSRARVGPTVMAGNWARKAPR